MKNFFDGLVVEVVTETHTLHEIVSNNTLIVSPHSWMVFVPPTNVVVERVTSLICHFAAIIEHSLTIVAVLKRIAVEVTCLVRREHRKVVAIKIVPVKALCVVEN